MQEISVWVTLVTSVCLLFVEHAEYQVDYHRRQVKYYTHPYLLWNLCLVSLVITIAVKFRHSPVWLISLYEVVWVHAVWLQVKV
jgi:hypothetical protein